MNPAPQRGARPTAIWLLRNGLHPIATRPGEKRPLETGWAKTLPDRKQLLDVFEEFPKAGVGMALGPEHGVIDFEIDDESFKIPEGLPPSIGWQSARGQHLIYRWDKRLEGLPAVIYLTGGAELRIGGQGKQLMSVAPPTVGTNRKRRTWNQVWELSGFPGELLRMMEKPPVPRPRPIVVPPSGSRYADAVLRYEAQAVVTAVPGTRNVKLNRSAFCLGTLVGAGRLERATVEAVLLEAASACGLGEREATATINSGLEAGIKRPRV